MQSQYGIMGGSDGMSLILDAMLTKKRSKSGVFDGLNDEEKQIAKEYGVTDDEEGAAQLHDLTFGGRKRLQRPRHVNAEGITEN